jgi:hypothetical protein
MAEVISTDRLTTCHGARGGVIEFLRRTQGFGARRRWAVKECRHRSRHLEVDLLAAGADVVRERTGNRRLNAAIHRIAVTQIRVHDGARACLERRMAMGNTKAEAIRALKRRLSDVVYRRLLADAGSISVPLGEAACQRRQA